jgi:hypothetical protein
MHKLAQKEWEAYRDTEIENLRPILNTLGFSLDEIQPHTQGERYLMQAVTTQSGQKLILLGKEMQTDRRVVIKATNSKDGMQELEHERTCRRVLRQIGFSYQKFLAPEEILFTKSGPYLISIQAFIEQKLPFLERPLEEQFTLALQAFKAQESAHAATYEHAQLVRRTFGSIDAQGYLKAFESFKTCVGEHKDLFARATFELSDGYRHIEQYGGFLTHTDFVPHNFRVVDGAIYLLDHSSLRFGSKYEGWARFLNFMTLHNRPLETALLNYVRDNRTPEEYRALRLMRIYRLGEILCYYTRTLENSAGDLRTLNEARIEFWAQVLEATLKDGQISEQIVDTYAKLRDSLRSEEEKQRQQGLH